MRTVPTEINSISPLTCFARLAEHLLDHSREDRPGLVNHSGRVDPPASVVTTDHDGLPFVLGQVEFFALRCHGRWHVYAGQPYGTTSHMVWCQNPKLSELYNAEKLVIAVHFVPPFPVPLPAPL